MFQHVSTGPGKAQGEETQNEAKGSTSKLKFQQNKPKKVEELKENHRTVWVGRELKVQLKPWAGARAGGALSSLPA